MSDTVDIQKLFDLGAHFGHKNARTNPRARNYIYKVQNGVSIIDLFKTKPQIEAAQKVLFEQGKAGKTVLLVATKNIIQHFAREAAVAHNVHYMTQKWVGGFFTNHDEVEKNINRINTWSTEKNTGVWDGMIKHERSRLEKELAKYLRVYEGVLTMNAIPDVVVMIDIKKEHNALMECQRMQLKEELAGKEPLTTIAVTDTNADPTEVNYPIVVNDDTPGVVEYVLTLLLDAYDNGRKQYKEPEVENKEENGKK